VTFDVSQIWLTGPLNLVLAGGVLVLLLEAFAGGRNRGYLLGITVGILAAAFALELWAWPQAADGASRSVFSGMLRVDRLSIFADCTFLLGAALSALLAPAYMRERRFEFGEFYALLLFGTGGMMILGAATDFVTVFLGVETMSIAVYVLTGAWRRNPRSSEGAMKYFLAGAFASGILLYGIALTYGAVGSTSLDVIAREAPRVAGQPLFIIGMLLIIVGFGFKVAAVPFHMWAPDAYEGAPTPVTAFMAAGVKAAAFVTLLRIFGGAYARPELAFGASGWAQVLAIVSVVTMTVGNLAALRQDNIKRLLAYSSIAHAGYLLIGVAALAFVGNEARGPMLYYLFAYTFTTVGSFGVVAWLGNRKDERLSLDDWAGLGSRHPAMALAMTIFLLSLGGVPPTAGFFGKFYVFRAALGKHGLEPYVVIAVLNSVVSFAYYLRVVTAMYFREVGKEPQPTQSRTMQVAILIAVIAVLAFGIFPDWLSTIAAATAG
jgi:NADH-quinone oxidoreductase subunit N